MTDEEMIDDYIKENNLEWELECHRTSPIAEVRQALQKGTEFGYRKGKEEAREIIEGLMRFCRCFAQHHTEDIRYKEAEQFLKEVEK